MRHRGWICVLSLCHVIALVQGPCFECMIYDNQLKKEQLLQSSALDGHGCPFECSCSSHSPKCKSGIPLVKDGCNCCKMCARQMGEPCSYRFICDKTKHLLCHYFNSDKSPESSHESAQGICQKARGLTCTLNGKTYGDGTQFSTDCRHKCICLDGRISCTDICHSQEAFPPPEVVCPGAILFQPNGQCCKQWLCSQARKHPLPIKLKTPVPESLKQDQSPLCKAEERRTTEWTPCNKFCGVGLSTRFTTDNLECRNITENRICHWRPCSMDGYLLGNSKCKPTIRVFRHIKLTFTLNVSESGESPQQQHQPQYGVPSNAPRQVLCRSVRTFRPKYCSNCLSNQCCTPDKTKTKSVQFVCENGQTYFRKWEWVKKCVCRPGKCLH